MKLKLSHKTLTILAGFFLSWAGLAFGQVATNITGLYYTGDNGGGGLLPGGTTDPHWAVTYAYANGMADNPTYQGAAYVVNPIDGGWVANTTSAQWIVAPGATNAGGTVNAGGDILPGNGTTGVNSSVYVYTLAFQIVGSGAAGTVSTSQIAITLTIAADDQYQVYVNPTLNANGSVNTGSSTMGGSGTSAWSNTKALTLQNFGAGQNAVFKIGTNYLTIVVNNTNSQTGTLGAGDNASGLLVYQVGTAMTINGKPVVPEVGTWLPVALAIGVCMRQRFFRRSMV